MNHLKRGKVLRETLLLTYLVYEVSQTSSKADTSAASKDQGTPLWEGHGDRSQPVWPFVQRLGSRKERMGQGDAHAPSLVLLESSMRHTGGASEDAKRRGEVGRGKRLTKVRGLRGESDGAEESAHGTAVPTRMRTDGEGL